MGFDPASVLTDEEKQQLIDQRVKAWAIDAFSHQLNKDALEALPPSEDRDAEIAKIDESLAALTSGIQAAVGRSDALKAERAKPKVGK